MHQLYIVPNASHEHPLVPNPCRGHQLSALERSVLLGLASGLQSKEIAQVVERSKPTVESYVRILFVKFDARSRAHLVAKAILCGALEHRALEAELGLERVAQQA